MKNQSKSKSATSAAVSTLTFSFEREKFTSMAVTKSTIRLLVVFLVFIGGVERSWGQLLQWNTFGNLGTETIEPSVANATGITPAALTLGIGVTPAANSNRLGGNDWFDSGDTNPTTLAEAVADNDYIEFVVTPTSGYVFTPTTLNFIWDRSATGPSDVTLRSSADGFTADIATVSGIISGSFAVNSMVIPGMVNLVSPITFRLFAYNATSTVGTGGFDVSTDMVNVELLGAANCLVRNVNTSLNYCTLQAAIDAASPNEGLELLANITEGLIIINKTLSIDGNGFTINSTSPTYGINPAAIGISIQDLTLQDAGTYGIQTDCGADFLLMTNVTINSSGNSGVSIYGSDNCTLNNITSTSNGGNGVNITNCDNTTITGITTSGNSFMSGFNAGIGIFTSGTYCLPAGVSGFTLGGTISIAETTKVYSQKANAADPLTGISGTSIDWAVGIGALDRSYWPDKATAYAVVDALFEPPYNYSNSLIYVADVVTENFYVDDDPAGDATPPMLIQTAVTYEVPGKTIFLETGTFSERVTLDKSLTLDGTGIGSSVLDGTGLAGNGNGITLNTGVTNVTIKDLTVRDYAGANGNVNGGIYAIGGNNNLTVQDVDLADNVGGSGFYANGPIDNVLLNNVDAHGHTVAARGIVIWNGLKSNITITNCEVYGNNCCGIELQDGTATGVTMTGNFVHDNGDNGIGIVGMQAPGANLIQLNTVTNNGRFGIEIKNPDGSGAASGAGSVVVNNNTVTRTLAIGDARDISGIAVFRRGVQPGNVEVPEGVYVSNNTVSGYTQPSNSEGFGIVIEGINHTVTGNNITGNDVGLQQQAGHTPLPPADGDPANLVDTYFGRGNAQMTCGNTITGNTISGNTTNTRDVGVGGGLVTNMTTNAVFCSIQDAIDDPLTVNDNTIIVDAGFYNEAVTVYKSVNIQGANAGIAGNGFRGAESIVDGNNGTRTGFAITTTNVTIDGFKVQNCGGVGFESGIFTNSTGSLIKNNILYNNEKGVYPSNTGPCTVEYNLFDSNNRSGPSGQVGLLSFTSNSLSVLHNEFKGQTSNAAVLFDGSASHSNLTFKYNYLHDNHPGSSCVYVAKVTGGEFANNYITNGKRGFKIAGGNNTISIHNNIITGTVQADIMVNLDFGANSGIQAHNNSLTSAVTIVNEDATVVDATCNWYGSLNPAATIVETNPNTVTYIPFQTNGVDMGGNPFDGFQPSVGCACTVMATATPTPSSCPLNDNGSVLANVTMSVGVVTYLWSNGQTTNPATGLVNGTYTVTVSDVNGCTTTASATVMGDNLGPVHNTNTGLNYCTIQAAINDPLTLDGAIITVDAGTYTETGQIVISKNLTITGADKTTTFVKPDANTAYGGSWILVNPGKTLNLSKFTLDGTGKLIYTGIKQEGNGLVNDCIITGIKYNESTDYKGTAIHIESTGNVNVTNSTFAQIGRNGILADNCTGTYSGNTYTGKGTGNWLDYFILSEYGDDVVISGNTIQNCTGVALSDGSGSAAIAVWDDPGTQAIISGNTMTTNSVGVAVVGYSGGTEPQVEFGAGNVFDGGEYGISLSTYFSNISNPAITFTGASTFKGQTQQSISLDAPNILVGTNIDISAQIFKTAGDVVITDNFAKENLVRHAIDAPNRGLFVWNPTNVYVTTSSFFAPETSTAKIQRGIDASSANWTVNVGPGTFASMDISIPISVIGQGIGVTIDDHSTDPNLGNNVTIHDVVGNVLVTGFTLKTSPASSVHSNGVKITNVSGGTCTITNNEIWAYQSAAGTAFENYGVIAGYGSTSKLVFDNNTVYGGGDNPMLVEKWLGETEITNNTIHRGPDDTASKDALFMMNYGTSNITAKQLIENNTIDMGGGTVFTSGTRGVGISVVGDFTALGTTGGFTDVRVTSNEIVNLKTGRRGISTWNNSPAPGIAGDVRILINKNKITPALGFTGEFGVRILGLSTVADILNNDVSGVTDAVKIQPWNSHSASGVLVNNNSLIPALYAINNLTANTVAGTCNWYGTGNASTIAALMNGLVTYTNWISTAGDSDAGPGFTPTGLCNGSPVVIASATPTDIHCGDPSGSINVIWSGGVANYIVSWSGTSSGSQPGLASSPYSITGLAAGTYNVTVTDANLSTATVGPVSIQYLPVTNTTDNPDTYYATIQAAIDAASNGDVITICSGAYNENVNVTKELTLTGAGNGSNPATNTVLTPSVACSGVGFTISAANVTIQNMYVTNYQTAVQLNGVVNPTINDMSLIDYCQYGIRITGSNSSVDITQTDIQRLSLLAGTVGIRVGTADAVSGMLIDNCTITGNALQGITVFQAAVPVAFDNIIIQNSTISNNTQKGLYFEKLSNATLQNLTMANNGTDAAYGFNNGIDINLKYDDYANITIQNCDITNSGYTGTSTDPQNPAAIAIKARDDANSYNTNPATLIGVNITNNRISGPQNGIRFGEFGKINNTPSNVTVEGNDLSYLFAHKAVIRRTNDDVNMLCNWHGSTSLPVILATFAEAGTGSTILSSILLSGGDGNPSVGFQPSGLCGCPSGNLVTNTNTPETFCTIQAAINDPDTDAGDVIVVGPGTYIENIYLNQDVDLRGNNYGINPNTGMRIAESIIVPATSDPDPTSLTAVNIMYLDAAASGSVIDGFTIDGDNPNLTSAVNINGANIDAIECIAGYEGTGNLTISNNILRNVTYAGIDMYNYYNSGASTSNNYITGNKIDNIAQAPYGIGVLIYNNFYAAIENNVMTRVRAGVQTGNFYNANTGSTSSISNNTIEASRRGIFHNLAYGSAGSFTIAGNTISNPTSDPTMIGLSLSAIGDAVGANVTGNNINGAYAGVDFWNCTSTPAINVNGGLITNCTYGVVASNYDGYNSNANSSAVKMSGVTVTGSTIAGVHVKDNPLNSNGATIQLTVDTDCEINGTGQLLTGILVTGPQASATVQGNDASINGFAIGIDVDGGSATITNNHIYDNGIGVRFTNAGTGNVNTNNFDGGVDPDNGTDIQATATAGVVTASPNNSLAGSLFGVQNLSGNLIDATLNYWESASGPGPVGPGSGANVTLNVEYCPWYNNVPPALMGPGVLSASPFYNTMSMLGYCSLQDAISAASSNDVIEVQPGNYYEVGQIVINKNLTIVGMGADCDDVVFHPTMNTGSVGDARGWWLVLPGFKLSMQKVSLDGAGYLVYQAIRDKGFGDLDQVCFKNILYQESGPAYNGVAVAAFGAAPGSNVNITNSTFNNIGRVGVLYFGAGVDGSTFDGNTYTGKGAGDWLDYALDISAGAQVTVTDNIITGNLGVASSDGSTSAALVVTTYFGLGTEADINDNNLSGNTAAIVVGFDGADDSDVEAHNNNLSSNPGGGVTNSNPSNIVNATLNYWGDLDDSGPSTVGFGTGVPVSAGVLYCPWLDDAPPAGIAVPSPVASIAIDESSGLNDDDGIICAGASVTLDATAPNATYLWSTGATTSSIIVTLADTYTVTVTYPGGCTSMASVGVIVNPLPVLSGPPAVCVGSTIQWLPMGGMGIGTWTSSNNLIATITDAGVVTGVAPGMVTFTFTTTAGCSTTSSSVSVNPSPSATITTAPIVVSGTPNNPATIPDAGGGATYVWTVSNGTITGGQGTSSMLYTAGMAGSNTIAVTVTNSFGCVSVGSIVVNVINVGPSSMQWVPDNAAHGSCPAASNCCTNIICYGLEYTPGVSGNLTTYTTGFVANCTGNFPTGMTPVASNKSCVMTDNSFEINACATIDSILFNSSGNNGISVPVVVNVPVILHKVCFNLAPGDIIGVKEDAVTNLSASVDLTGGGQFTEFPSYTTTNFTKPLPIIPVNGSSTVSCPALATVPTPPVVLDYCGNNVPATLTTTVNMPDPIVCEGTRTYNFTYTDCSGYAQPWSYTYTIDHTIAPAEVGGPVSQNGGIVECVVSATAPIVLPVVQDQCGTSLSPTGPPTIGGTYAGCEGTYTYTYNYADCSGLPFSWTYSYTIDHTTAPGEVGGPVSQNGGTVECTSSAAAPMTLPVVQDVCGNVLSPTGPPTIGGTYAGCEGTYTYTYNYTDCSGLPFSWTYSYTIDHTTAPGEVGGPVSQNGGTVECTSSAAAPMTLPVVQDVCGNVLSPTGSPTIGGTYAGCEGTYTYTYNYTDCSGLPFSWTYSYTIDQTTPPAEVGGPVPTSSTVGCPLDAVAPDLPGAPAMPVVQDICGNVLTPSAPVQAGTWVGGCIGTITFTYTYTSCAGLTYVWTYTYTVDCDPLTLKVFLEGPYNTGTNLMDNDLNDNHLLPGQDKLLSPDLAIQLAAPFTPFGQPYTAAPWNHFGNLGLNYGDPSAPFAPMVVIPYPLDVVDWVLVTVRKNGLLPVNNHWTCAGWVHQDGDVTFPESCGTLSLNGADNYYVMVQHRNHLGILSPAPALEPCSGYVIDWDFTMSNSYQPTFRFGQKMVEPGVWAMHAANGEQITSISAISSPDRTTWRLLQGVLGYSVGDYNMSAVVTPPDETAWKNNQNKTSGVIFY